MSHESCVIYMIPGSKGLNPHELAHRWVKDLGTRHDMRILGELWECLARNNSQVLKSGIFDPDIIYMLLRKMQHYQTMYKTDIKAENI